MFLLVIQVVPCLIYKETNDLLDSKSLLLEKSVSLIVT